MSDDPALPRLPPVDASSAERVPAASLSPELLASLLADGDDQLAAWVLRHALAEAPRAEVFDGLLRDAMAFVGERWQEGQWSVAVEHLASRTLLRVMERIRPPAGSPEDRLAPVAVLAGVAGEQHMIGLVCLEQVLIEAGWSVHNLGADVPAEDLGRFVAREDVALVALSASDPERLASLEAAVAAVRANSPARTPILLGGQILERDRLGRLDVDWQGTSVGEAAAFAERVRPEGASGAA